MTLKRFVVVVLEFINQKISTPTKMDCDIFLFGSRLGWGISTKTAQYFSGIKFSVNVVIVVGF